MHLCTGTAVSCFYKMVTFMLFYMPLKEPQCRISMWVLWPSFYAFPQCQNNKKFLRESSYQTLKDALAFLFIKQTKTSFKCRNSPWRPASGATCLLKQRKMFSTLISCHGNNRHSDRSFCLCLLTYLPTRTALEGFLSFTFSFNYQ